MAAPTAPPLACTSSSPATTVSRAAHRLVRGLGPLFLLDRLRPPPRPALSERDRVGTPTGVLLNPEASVAASPLHPLHAGAAPLVPEPSLDRLCREPHALRRDEP